MEHCRLVSNSTGTVTVQPAALQRMSSGSIDKQEKLS